jgi:hypothetical protein
MEPERKIEKLLRAYAKKRRAQAGDSLKLHPATRRLLQGEVARRKPKSGDDKGVSVTLWELFRQRWALFAGFALLVFFGAALLLPALNSAKKKSESVATLANVGQISGPTNLGTPQLLAAKDSVSRQLSEMPLVLTDAAGNMVGASTIHGQSKFEAGQNVAKIADAGTPATSSGILAANAPAPVGPALDRLVKPSGAAGNDFKNPTDTVQLATAAVQNFASTAQNSFKNTISAKKATAVLANFQVQQNGSVIRVLDADGSVYDGSLQPEIAGAQKKQISAGAVLLPTDRENSQTAQNYFFRVSGTNLTLKQNVVFAGNLLANFSAPANGQQANNRNGNFDGGDGQLQSALTNQLPWANSRIAGTAVVADTNNIEINAVPQSP